MKDFLIYWVITASIIIALALILISVASFIRWDISIYQETYKLLLDEPYRVRILFVVAVGIAGFVSWGESRHKK